MPVWSITKVLVEVGMVNNKLSWKNSSNGCGSDGEKDINFSWYVNLYSSLFYTLKSNYVVLNGRYVNCRFILRQDLMESRTQVEYGFFYGIIDQVSYIFKRQVFRELF